MCIFVCAYVHLRLYVVHMFKMLCIWMSGIELADTITLDAHKQLYVPMGCGMLFYKTPTLSTAVQMSANYIIRKESHDMGKVNHRRGGNGCIC